MAEALASRLVAERGGAAQFGDGLVAAAELVEREAVVVDVEAVAGLARARAGVDSGLSESLLRKARYDIQPALNGEHVPEKAGHGELPQLPSRPLR